MFSDPKVYRAASLMLKIYGTNAGYQVALEAEESHNKGDVNTCAAWEKVYEAIEEFLSSKVPPGMTVH